MIRLARTNGNITAVVNEQRLINPDIFTVKAEQTADNLISQIYIFGGQAVIYTLHSFSVFFFLCRNAGSLLKLFSPTFQFLFRYAI